MRVTLLKEFDFVAAVGPIDDAFGANGVALACEAVVAHCLIRVSIAHLLRQNLLGHSGELRLRI